MPVRVFVSFLGTCRASSREHAVLRNSTVEPVFGSADNIETLCGVGDTELLLDHAKRLYPEATPYIEHALKSVRRHP